MFRVGFGQDSHKFSQNDKPLILGGALIEGEKGLDANSDGDVILHALFNALSQSVGGKSLGYYADILFEKGITDSKEYLNVARGMIDEKGYKINNIGIMIEAKKPRLDKHSANIKKSLTSITKLDFDRIGITATSGEGLTAFGRGEGIKAEVIVSLIRK